MVAWLRRNSVAVIGWAILALGVGASFVRGEALADEKDRQQDARLQRLEETDDRQQAKLDRVDRNVRTICVLMARQLRESALQCEDPPKAAER